MKVGAMLSGCFVGRDFEGRSGSYWPLAKFGCVLWPYLAMFGFITYIIAQNRQMQAVLRVQPADPPFVAEREDKGRRR